LSTPVSPFASPANSLTSGALGGLNATPAAPSPDLSAPTRSRVWTPPQRPDFSVPQRAF
jgi:hypothetical protein